MKHNIAEGKRWLKQAQHDLLVAQKNLENKFYADSCYSAEQASQKAFKGYLYLQGARFVWEHSVAELAKRAAAYKKSFQELVETGKILDQYYIPTRYPDALAPPAVPFESYTKKEALEALKIAQKILSRVQKEITSYHEGTITKTRTC